jgi:hypothetical protein
VNTATEIRMQMAEAWPRLLAMAEAMKPHFMVIGRVQAAIIQAHVKFAGRDRRRIKREVNKAVRRARRGL